MTRRHELVARLHVDLRRHASALSLLALISFR
ncbi:hypothetical protein JOF53_004567 [Crossiella equi]|uniref:Uncharacterized protein n=1 Tax=Crossiella equi TaxID=130796 RepID=A0ABS5AGJ3_9PSEU|nr:hypothetical protein [Crossiella equi]